MEHKLAFPLNPFETPTSYVSRLTRYCGLSSPTTLCADLGFKWHDYVRGDETLLARISAVGGADPDLLSRWSIKTIGNGRYTIRGHRCAKGTIYRTRVQVCPKCLREDAEQHGENGAYRRYYWQLTSIRCCAKHSVGLLQLPTEQYAINAYDFVGQVEKNWDLILAASESPVSREPSEFEQYVFDRLEGVRQHTFLDGLSLHAATKLCETLGFVMLFGPLAKLSKATEAEMHRAGKAGYDALKSGQDGLLDTLGTLISDQALSTIRQKSDLGAFYEWMYQTPFPEEVEPVRRIVREYIFEHYPVPDGYEVLGRACSKRSVYTVEAACKTLGMERKRIGRYLIFNGLAERGGSVDGISLKRAIEHKDVATMSDEIQGRITATEALKMLHTKQKMLQDLCELRLVTQELDALDHRPKYDRAKLQALMTSVADRAANTSGSVANLLPLADVAQRLRCRSAEILALIVAGKLKAISADMDRTGLDGIAIDLDEVRCALPKLVMPGITRSDAATKLRVTHQTINYLIDQNLVMSARMRSPKSRQSVTAISEASIERFLWTYDTLGLMAFRYRRTPGPFGCHLEARGIYPLDTPPGVSRLYKRRGLEARLRKIGLVVPTSKETQSADRTAE
ncbi:TniQ family protein [Ruegeria sp. MALMAid1280]|uniref:TniQ family protein n=1 Tax=Ruegeria sp. MALMAid1280 TaxID=3411634 RepID=UPI003BA27328